MVIVSDGAHLMMINIIDMIINMRTMIIMMVLIQQSDDQYEENGDYQ